MKLQIITRTGMSNKFTGAGITESAFCEVRALDDFEVNVIVLDEEFIWYNKGSTCNSVNEIKNFRTLNTLIKNSKKGKVMIILPQNYHYNYDFKRDFYNHSEYRKSEQLKDMLSLLVDDIISKLYPINFNLIFSNTITKIAELELVSDFVFSGIIDTDVLTESAVSKMPTTIKTSEIIFTTLKISNTDELDSLLLKTGIRKYDEIVIPEWMNDIEMFDDNKQNDIIKKCEKEISKQRDVMDKARSVLNINNKYKSILYTNSDKLVEIVFDILKEILGCNLSDYKDIKEADFIFEKSKLIFIGEIKGIKSNVKSINITQLELHQSTYLDKHTDINADLTRKILIINHQRKIPIKERDPIDTKQIDIATKYGSLIVETSTLLGLLEKYRLGELDQNKCIELFSNKTGLLTID